MMRRDGDNPYEQWMAALIRQAVRERIDEQILRDERSCPDAERSRLAAELAEMHPRVKRRIERALRKRRAALSWKKRLGEALRSAAVAVAVLAVAFSGLCLASPAIRAKLYQMRMVRHDTHTEISMDVDWSRLERVPEKWQGHFYPLYVPERLSEVYVTEADADAQSIMFLNPQDENDNLYFSETGYDSIDFGAGMAVDTENAQISYETINGRSVMVVVQAYGITLIWQDGTHVLMLAGGTDMEEMTTVYENVDRISD